MNRSLVLAGACIACVALPHPVRAQIADAPPISLSVVADKLGVSPMPGAPRELEPGHSATGMLAEPKKLVPYGITGVHEGARVTFTCVGPNRLRVEAEEMEPVATKIVVTLHVADDGSMTQVPDRAPPKAPAP